MILSNTQLFRGIDEQEIPSLFQCLGASKSEYKKGEVILAEGRRSYPTMMSGEIQVFWEMPPREM